MNVAILCREDPVKFVVILIEFKLHSTSKCAVGQYRQIAKNRSAHCEFSITLQELIRVYIDQVPRASLIESSKRLIWIASYDNICTGRIYYIDLQ